MENRILLLGVAITILAMTVVGCGEEYYPTVVNDVEEARILTALLRFDVQKDYVKTLAAAVQYEPPRLEVSDSTTYLAVCISGDSLRSGMVKVESGLTMKAWTCELPVKNPFFITTISIVEVDNGVVGLLYRSKGATVRSTLFLSSLSVLFGALGALLATIKRKRK